MLLLLLAACTQTKKPEPTCASCHADQQAAWDTSHHAHAQAVSTQSLDGGLTARFVIGVEPLQQFAVEVEPETFQIAPLARDVDGGWRELHAAVGDWKRPRANWNGSCAPCHATGFKTNETKWRALNVTCEACHGSAHPDSALRRTSFAFIDGGAIASAMSKPNDVQLETCAACHLRRSVLVDGAMPRDGLFNGFEPELMTQGAFDSNGALHDEVFEMASFSMSRMAQAGVRCSHCHDPHSGKTRAPGSALCAQCHRSEVFDVEAHRGEKQCVDCHMPPTTFMGNHVRRDHRILVPGRNDDRFARVWKGDGDAGLSLINDARLPAFTRASAVSLLRAPWTRAKLEAERDALNSDDTWIRFAATGVLTQLPDEQRVMWGRAMLEDPQRAMRVRAARALGESTPELLSAADANRFRGEGWLQLGDAARARGDDAVADQLYASGLKVDPEFMPLIINRADLLRAQGIDDAPMLREAIGHAGPWTNDVAYALGLSCWRKGQKEEAVTWFSIAMTDDQEAHVTAWKLSLSPWGEGHGRGSEHAK